MSDGDPITDQALQDHFRADFFPDEPAGWLVKVTSSRGESQLEIEQKLAALASGQRDFSYSGGHDRAAFRLLRRLIGAHGLRSGADIGSTSGNFPAMQLFHGIERVTVFEVREPENVHPKVDVVVHDLSTTAWTGEPFDLVTCMSTIEHVGLGRYGDPIDPEGDLRMFANLASVVRPGGRLVVSFPEGPGCVHFNLHRIYSTHRRDRMFRGFRLLERVETRIFPKRIRDWLFGRTQRLGWSYQPLYVLTRD